MLGNAGWYEGESNIIPEAAVSHWTEHSERHVLPRLALALGHCKEDRDCLGRWKADGSDVYIQNARSAVLRVQEDVAQALRKGELRVHQEEDIVDGVRTHLTERGCEKGDVEAILNRMVNSSASFQLSLTAGRENEKVDEQSEETFVGDLFSSDESDGFGAQEEEIEHSSEDEEDQTVSLPYWMVVKTGRLHRNVEARCSWQPHRIKRQLAWFKTLEEGKASSTVMCRHCFALKEASSSEGSADDDSQEEL